MIEAPSKERFCRLVTAGHYGMRPKNYWSGSAFGSHPCGIFRERMIFANHWHVDKACDVKVMTDPSAKLVLGHQDSASHGNAYPSASCGELVTVYRHGNWIADGPWCEKIIRILDDLESEWDEMLEVRKAKDEARTLASQKAAQDSLRAAAAALA